MKTAKSLPSSAPPPKVTMPNASEDVEQLDALHIASSVKIHKGEPHNGSGGQKGSSQQYHSTSVLGRIVNYKSKQKNH